MKRQSLLAPFLASLTLLHVACVWGADSFAIERRNVDFSYGKEERRDIILRQGANSGPGTVAEQRITAAGSRFLRVHFKLTKGAGDGGWKVEISNGRGDTTPVAVRGDAFWSGEIAGDTAVVLLTSTGPRTDAELLIDKVLVATTEVRPESITTNRRDIVPISMQRKEIRDWGQSVARIRFVADGTAYVCTGFLVGDRIMLTNQHCLDTEEVAQSALIDFKFDLPQATPEVATVKTFFFSDYNLDYAVVELDKQPDGVRALVISAARPAALQDALVIQHPGGEFKQVSIINCTIKDAETLGRVTKSDFGHLCNTLGGSSGSPVMDRGTGVVMGLHHLGFKPGDANPSNQGVRLGEILEDIRSRDASIYARLNVAP